MLNVAALMPTPSVSMTTMSAVTAGFRRSGRQAKRASCSSTSSAASQVIARPSIHDINFSCRLLTRHDAQRMNICIL
jgi:hypothetical protein